MSLTGSDSDSTSEEGGEEQVSWVAVKDVGEAEDRNSKFRRTMEDAHVCIDSFGGGDKNAFFGVYDGHGVRGAVNYTQAHLHQNFLSFLKEKEPSEAFVEAYVKTDKDMESANIGYSGTTVVTSYIKYTEEGKRILYAANAGDARAVISREGKALRLTYDHKGSDESEQKRIQEAGGLVVMNRVSGILAVTRSLGDHKMKKYVIGTPHTSEPIELNENDSFLIIACDGLWDIVSDQEACDFVNKAENKDKPCQKLAIDLLHTAIRGGSTDNITVIVIRL